MHILNQLQLHALEYIAVASLDLILADLWMCSSQMSLFSESCTHAHSHTHTHTGTHSPPLIHPTTATSHTLLPSRSSISNMGNRGQRLEELVLNTLFPALVPRWCTSVEEEETMPGVVGDLVPLSLSVDILQDGPHADQHAQSHDEPQEPGVRVGHKVC